MPSSLTDRLYGLNTAVAVKAPVRVASTGNITLSSTQVVDGVALSTGDRVLVQAQTNSTENGIYECRSSTWGRTADFDGSLDVVRGTLVYVTTGTAYGGSFFTVNSTGINIPGSSAITFTQSFFPEFNDLQALTFSTGDLIYFSSGSSLTRLAIGASATVLTSTGGVPKWVALAPVLVDLATPTLSTGNIFYYSSGSSFTNLAIGASATVLTSTGGRPQWVALAAPLVDLAALTFSTGDIIYYSTGSSLARIALGASATVLTSTGGIPAWKALPTGISLVSQYTSTETGTTAAFTAAIPFDNTIPQVTEGTQIMSLSFVPLSTSSTIIIESQAFLSPSTAENVSIALFSSTSNAIAANQKYMSGAGFNGPIYLRKTLSALSSGTTFSVRAGPNSTTTTVTFNGQSGAGLFGGVLTSFLSVTEYST